MEMIGCRNVVVAGVRCAGRGRKTHRECVKDELGLHPEWVGFRDMGVFEMIHKKWSFCELSTITRLITIKEIVK